MKITKKTKLNDLLSKKPESAWTLIESGLGCVGCHLAETETLEEGCKVHGISDKEIDKLIEKLNGKKSEKKKAKKKIKKKSGGKSG